MPTKTQADVCPLCDGTGWKTLPLRAGESNDRRVTRCDCQMRARNQSLLSAANIPRRYEHCELSSFKHEDLRSRAAYTAACRFVKDYPLDKTGLLFVGNAGAGKTHLAV